MAHLEINTFVSSLSLAVKPFFRNPRVLEIGSYDVNGTIRSAFKYASEYIGVDLIPGPSVDVVSKGQNYKSVKKFDIVLSVESFEHNSEWVQTFINMVNLTKDDGLVIFTCATAGRLEHGTNRTDPLSSPGTSSKDNSYYRNLEIHNFNDNFFLNDLFISHGFFVNKVTRDLYFYGLKGNKRLKPEKIQTFFNDAINASSRIRKTQNYVNFIFIKIFYLSLFPFYKIFPDSIYQKITYFPYKKIRQILNNFRA